MTTNSYAALTGSLSLSGGGTSIELPFETYLEEFTIELVTAGSWTATITLFDPSFDDLELAILAAEADRNIELRFGWDDPIDPLIRTFKGWITRYRPEFQPHGTSLTLEVMARSLGPTVVDKTVRSYKEGMRASEIVQAIAEEQGWSTSDLAGNVTIEPTEPPLETPFNTKGESAFNFLRDQILKQAKSANGGSDYRLFFDEEGALHFHTSTFISAPTHLYRYARDMSGDVISFAPADMSLFGVLSGGGNARYSSSVSAQGGTAEVQSSATGGVNGEGGVTSVDSAAKRNRGDGIHSFVNLFSRHPAEVERIARSRHEHYRRFAYQAELTVRGTHRVRPLDYVRAEVIKGNGELHYLSGNFQVFKVKHSVSVGEAWETSYEMLREGIGQQDGTEPIVASETVNPQAAGDQSDSVNIGVEG